MNFDRNPKGTSKKTSNIPNMFNHQIPPFSLNIKIPKNNLGKPEEDSQSRSSTPVNYNPRVDVFSPIPQKHWSNGNRDLSSHYSLKDFDWGEPSFGFGMEPSEENIPQSDNPPAQRNAALENETSKQSIPNEFVPNDKGIEKQPINNYQGNPTTAAPAANATAKQYRYESLEEAFIEWLNSLKVKSRTKSNYRAMLIELIRILDSKGMYSYSEIEVSDYCDEYMKGYDRFSIRNLKSAIKRFFSWVQMFHIYAQIRPNENMSNNSPINNIKQQYESQQATQFIGKSLSTIFNEWSKSLQSDVDTNVSYKIQILDFILFLTAIRSLQPTRQNLINFLKRKCKVKGHRITREYKQAIKSFLQFIEQIGLPQDPKVYDFLDSDIEIF